MSLRIALVLALLAACTWVPAGWAQDTPRVKRVVILHGGEALSPYYRAVDQALRDAFRDEIGAGAQFYSEYADVARFGGDAQARELADFLRARYAGKTIDLVFVTEPVALAFMARFRDAVFPGVPVVFMNVRQSTLERAPPPDGFVGVPAEIWPEATLELALRLFSDAHGVVIVSGSDALGRLWEELWRTAAAKVAPALPVRSLSGLSFEDIERTLGGLDRRTIVLCGSFFRDGIGRFHGDTWEVLRRLSAASQAPVFSHLQQAVGRGAVGTVSVPPEMKAAEAAALGKSILAGTPPAALALPRPVEARPYVDWRELRRWGIDERLLPPDTEVLFRAPTFWDTYRYHVLAVAALILVETALIVALLLQRARRRGAELALRESEAHFRMMADTAPVMIWRCDAAMHCDFVNAPWTAFTGRSVDDAVRRGWAESVHHDDRVSYLDTFRRAFTRREPFRMEYRLCRSDGEFRWVLDVGIPRSESSRFTGYIGSCLDITDRKAAERALEAAHVELGRLSRLSALGEFAATIAHEIRQPLTAIIMNARSCLREIAAVEQELPEVRAALIDVVAAGERAEEVIHRNRRLFRDRSVETKPLDINGVIRESLAMMSVCIAKNDVALVTALADGLPMVHGDRIELSQVLLNLVANALEAMESVEHAAREIRVTSSAHGEGVLVSVADVGVGLAGVDPERIFTLSYTTKASGTGVGLSISRSIIEAHGGRLWAESDPGGGAVFRFTIPIPAQ